jgi:predicted site-specific integrase-resolvase
VQETTLDELSLEPLTISLKTLATSLNVSRSSVRRWLDGAGIRPVAMNNGPKSAIRYRWSDVKVWLRSRRPVR